MRFSTAIYFNDNVLPNAYNCLLELYNRTLSVEKLFGKNKVWYEKGYSKKQALQYIVFSGSMASQDIVDKWSVRCKKDYPLLIEGVWDGENDNSICSINYMRKHVNNPAKTNIEISLTGSEREVTTEKMIVFFKEVINDKFDAYAFIHTNGYWFNEHNVFPDRICAGWMIYIPHIINDSLIPEAAKIVPVMLQDKQKGTIIVSIGEIFDGTNKEHIAKANDIEIRLLDLGLLPLMTEL